MDESKMNLEMQKKKLREALAEARMNIDKEHSKEKLLECIEKIEAASQHIISVINEVTDISVKNHDVPASGPSRACPQAIAEKIHNKKIGMLAGKRVLVAEDNELDAEIAKELLRQNGIVVDIAENGIKVLDMIYAKGENYYDCILMDVQMPIMNGYEATRKLREGGRKDLQKIPIIAMKADFTEDVGKVKEAGMSAHVAKPIELLELMEVFSLFL